MKNFTEALARLISQGDELKALRANQLKALKIVQGGTEITIPVLRANNISPDLGVDCLGIIKDRSSEIVHILKNDTTNSWYQFIDRFQVINENATRLESKRDVNLSWGCIANEPKRAERKLQEAIGWFDNLLPALETITLFSGETHDVTDVAPVAVPPVEEKVPAKGCPKKKPARKTQKKAKK